MNRFLIFSFFVFPVGLLSIGCEYLQADDECYPIEEVTSCRQFDNQLEKCGDPATTFMPGCWVEELCTDVSDRQASEADEDTDASDTDAFDTDTADAGDADQDGQVCKSICAGEPVPCDIMDENQCGSAVYCDWFQDPKDIEDQFQ